MTKQQTQVPPPSTCTPQLFQQVTSAMIDVLVARNLTPEQLTGLSKNYYSALSHIAIDGSTAEQLLGSINAKIAINRALAGALLGVSEISLKPTS